MSARPPVRINGALPELTPAQATSLWNFLVNLQTDIWESYEAELLAFYDACSPPVDDSEDNLTAYVWKDLSINAPASPVNNDDFDPDLDSR